MQPKFTQKLVPQNVNEGDKVELVAKFTGTEPLDVQWCKDKKSIKSDDGFDISINKGVATVKFAKVLPKDSGEYSLVVKNQFGSVTSLSRVAVKGK